MPAERLVALVRLPPGVHEWRVVRERRLEVGHDRQRLEVDLDQRRRLAGDLGRQRRDAGDDVALEADGVPGEQAPVLDHPAVEHVGHVLVRDDGEHARERARLRRVDARDPRVRMVGVAERGVELARERQVGRVAACAGHLLLPVRPDERCGRLLHGGHGTIQPRRGGAERRDRTMPDLCQSGYSSFRHARGSVGDSFGVSSSGKLNDGATNGSGAATVWAATVPFSSVPWPAPC